MAPKPAYQALRRLVKEEWWVAPTRLRTDAQGRVVVRGWAGGYAISAAGTRFPWDLRAGVPEVDVVLIS